MTECTAEFVDGAYDYESCICDDALHDEVELRLGAGDITEAQARLLDVGY